MRRSRTSTTARAAREELALLIGDGNDIMTKLGALARSGSRDAVAVLLRTSFGKALLESRGVKGSAHDELIGHARYLAVATAVKRGATVREVLAGKALQGIGKLGAARVRGLEDLPPARPLARGIGRCAPARGRSAGGPLLRARPSRRLPPVPARQPWALAMRRLRRQIPQLPEHRRGPPRVPGRTVHPTPRVLDRAAPDTHDPRAQERQRWATGRPGSLCWFREVQLGRPDRDGSHDAAAWAALTEQRAERIAAAQADEERRVRELVAQRAGAA